MKETQNAVHGVRKLFVHSVADVVTLTSFPRHF